MGPVGDLSKDCYQIVLKCLHLARIGRPDILWSVNKLSRATRKWTGACDKRLARLISYIHHTCEFTQYCHVGNTAPQCRIGLFQDSDFARDPEDSNSTSGGLLYIFGSHTFVPMSWMCKKETSVSRNSTEAEIISLDADLCMGGIPALDLWDLVFEVFHSSPNQLNNTKDQMCFSCSSCTFSFFLVRKHTRKFTWQQLSSVADKQNMSPKQALHLQTERTHGQTVPHKGHTPSPAARSSLGSDEAVRDFFFF